MKKKAMLAFAGFPMALLLGGALVGAPWRLAAADRDEDCDEREGAEVQRGIEISPVPLDLHHKKRQLVGLGSYIVNAQANCSNCHTKPGTPPGPFLTGGRPFPVPDGCSPNLTPDNAGRPGGMSFDQFYAAITTGADPHVAGRTLQIMPWPVFKNMTEHDIRAIYEYLRAIPHEDSLCAAP